MNTSSLNDAAAAQNELAAQAGFGEKSSLSSPIGTIGETTISEPDEPSSNLRIAKVASIEEENGKCPDVFDNGRIEQVSVPSAVDQHELALDLITALSGLSEMMETESTITFLRQLDVSSGNSTFWANNRGNDFTERPLILNNPERPIPVVILEALEDGSTACDQITPPIMMAGATTVTKDPGTGETETHEAPNSVPTPEENRAVRTWVQRALEAHYTPTEDKNFLQKIRELTVPENVTLPLTIGRLQEILDILPPPNKKEALAQQCGLARKELENLRDLVQQSGVMNRREAESEEAFFQKAFLDLTEPERYLLQACYYSAQAIACGVGFSVGSVVAGILSGGYAGAAMGAINGAIVGTAAGGYAGASIGIAAGTSIAGAPGAVIGATVGAPVGMAAGTGVGAIAGGVVGGAGGAVIGGVTAPLFTIPHAFRKGTVGLLGPYAHYAPEVVAAKAKEALREWTQAGQTDKGFQDVKDTVQTLQESDQNLLASLENFFNENTDSNPSGENGFPLETNLSTVQEVKQICIKSINDRIAKRAALIKDLEKTYTALVEQKKAASKQREIQMRFAHTRRGI